MIRPARRCLVCGGEFTPNSANHKYCCDKCRYNARDKPKIQHSPETLDWLKEKNQENMIHYYRPRLKQVLQGGDSGEIFTKPELRVLRDVEILRLEHTPKRNILTRAAVQALGGSS